MESEWWYLQGADKCGPVTKDELADLVRRHVLDARSLVWFPDMADWAPMGEVAALAALLERDGSDMAAASQGPPDPAAELHALDVALDDTSGARDVPAKPWRRFWARMIDLWVLSILTALLLGLAAGMVSPRLAAWMSQPGADIFLGFVILPLSLVVEAAIFGLTGSTLGKSILHVKVLTIQGRQPTFGQYLIRQAGVYWFAFALGLPFISLITMVVQHRRVKKGQGARYDAGRFQVLSSRISPLRIIMVVLAIVLIVLASGKLNTVTRADRPSAQRPHATGTTAPDTSS